MQSSLAPRIFLLGLFMLCLGVAWAGAANAASACAKIQLPAEAANAHRLTLHIEGLKMPPGKSGLIEVYASRADADPKSGIKQSNYVGYVALVPKNSLEVKRGISSNSLTVDLSDIPASLKAAKEIMVSLVIGAQGQNETEKKCGGEKEKSESGMGWERMYITAR
jgi:hypothetical protein